jgi:segregation and condensation protein B
VTTKTFLEVFGFASLRDLPDLERLDELLLETGWRGDDLDSVLGLIDTDAERPLGEARAVESN